MAKHKNGEEQNAYLFMLRLIDAKRVSRDQLIHGIKTTIGAPQRETEERIKLAADHINSIKVLAAACDVLLENSTEVE